jgi:hypothetical protein
MKLRNVIRVLKAGLCAGILSMLANGEAVAQGLSIPESLIVRGFPIDIPLNPGTYVSGPHAGISVADINGDGQSEILLSAIAVGPILIFKNEGTLANGWPAAGEASGFGYFAVADVVPGSPGAEIFAAHVTSPSPSHHQLFSSNGTVLPGWPVDSANYSAFSPAIRDLDNDGIPELFVEEEDFKLHAYTPSGQVLPGWPVSSLRVDGGCTSGQGVFVPTFIDLNHDGRLDVVYSNGGGGGGIQSGPCIEAYDSRGQAITGFPRRLPGIGLGQTVLNVADVDGDAIEDLITIQGNTGGDIFGVAGVQVLGLDGIPKRTMALESRHVFEGTTSLGDLDGDGVPEIVALAPSTMSVFNGHGEPLPGWPVRYYSHLSSNEVDTASLHECGVAVGDVDGDLQPDLVFCAAGGEQAEHTYLFILDRYGVPQAGSPYLLDALGSTGRGPVIADIDHDGHNEIVIASETQLWVLSLDKSRPHGKVEWQQFAADASNSGRYAPKFPAAASAVNLSLAGSAPQMSAGTTSFVQITVEKHDAGSANASFTVILPPEAKGRAGIPVGCTAFENEVTCPVYGFNGPGQKSVSIPVCIDTPGNYQLLATLRGSGPEADYVDNKALVHVNVSANTGSSCQVRAVPGRQSVVSLSGPKTIYTESPIYSYWRSFNVTGCSLVYPGYDPQITTSLGYDFHDSAAKAGLMHYELKCNGLAGPISSAVDVQVIDAPVTFSSSASNVTPGSTVTLTWNSQDMNSCEAKGEWSGARATSGTEQVAISLGAHMFEINCKGPLGIGYRRISVEGKNNPPPPNNPPPSSSGGGGGGALDQVMLAMLGLLVAVLSRRRGGSIAGSNLNQ